MCKHFTCDKLRKLGVKGVGLVVFTMYYGKTPVIMLGKERNGKYKNQYNICAGSCDKKDKGCILATLIRELKEEFKIKVSFGKEFDDIFRNKNNRIRYFVKGKTAIFIGVFNGLSRKPLNMAISSNNNDKSLSCCHKEMSKVDWFDITNKTNPKQIEGKKYEISFFASSVIKMLDTSKIY